MKRTALWIALLLGTVAGAAPVHASEITTEADMEPVSQGGAELLIIPEEESETTAAQDQEELQQLSNQINRTTTGGVDGDKIRRVDFAEDIGLPEETVIIDSMGNNAVGIEIR
jgi:predicted transcriptional regulator